VTQLHSKKEVIDQARAFAQEGFLCSESLLLALSKALNLESNIIPRIATGFGAGIGCHSEICGALSGAIMGLGLQFGRNHPSETPEGEPPYEYSKTMMDLFITRFRHIRCMDLLGLDISREEGLKEYRQKNLWETKCRDIIEITTGLAYDLLSAKNLD
jgi:C_GCAxxG_C_C family probable redox protein